jgi:hypothetical protein
MRTQLVYLAGPMSGLTMEECSKWRNEVKERLEAIIQKDGTPLYQCLSPCRGKEYLRGKGPLAKVDTEGLGWGETIVQRDRYDVMRSDVVIFNYLDAHKAGKSSIGTDYEQAWANIASMSMAKPIFSLVILDTSGDNPCDHEFVRRTASLVVPSVDAAVEFLEHVLNA